jgi:hypothetical protein
MLADLPDRFVQLRLAAAGDEDVSPSATKRRAVARPMPLLPPVMTATCPSSFFDMGLLCCP